MPLTLPKIVAAIREQQPGGVPHWFDFVQAALLDDDEHTKLDEAKEAVIRVLEAALWRAYSLAGSGRQRIIVVVYQSGEVHAVHPVDGAQPFGSDPLALVRALCHAVGVRLEDADG